MEKIYVFSIKKLSIKTHSDELVSPIFILKEQQMDEEKNGRKQINIRLETELYDFLVLYSKENYKTITAVVREMIANKFKEYKSLPVVRDK